MPSTVGWLQIVGKARGDVLSLNDFIRESLRCPSCGRGSLQIDDMARCMDESCGEVYPVVDGSPVLISARSSVSAPTQRDKAVKSVERWRTLGRNYKANANYRRLAKLLQSEGRTVAVLVVGGAVEGEGICHLSSDHIVMIETDIKLTQRVDIACDAHELPFEDATFDGVVAQAVLEHVADPYRCIDEIVRVTRPGGYLYVEVPFMQQVHAGRGHDFTRFTQTGLRRLCRRYEEIASGACCGPGMALAWAMVYYMLSFVEGPWTRRFVRAVSFMLLKPLVWADRWAVNRRGVLDAASAFYFLGRRAQTVRSDHEVMASYEGLIN